MKIPRARLARVEELWLLGRSERSIQRTVAREWTVTLRTVRRDIVRVQKKLAALPQNDPVAVKRRVEAMLLETYRVAKRGNKLGPQAAVMATVGARLAQLEGLLTDKIEHTGDLAPDFSKLSEEQLRQYASILAALRGKK